MDKIFVVFSTMIMECVFAIDSLIVILVYSLANLQVIIS